MNGVARPTLFSFFLARCALLLPRIAVLRYFALSAVAHFPPPFVGGFSRALPSLTIHIDRLLSKRIELELSRKRIQTELQLQAMNSRVL